MCRRCSSFRKGCLSGWITFGGFWAVCTRSNSIYTTILMPLYSYLVCPVSWNLDFIHDNYYFWCLEFSLRGKHKLNSCFALIGIVYDVDEAFKFYYCCLQFFWTHPETMQCFVVDTKSTFFRSLTSAPSIQKIVMVLKITRVILYQCYESFYCPSFIFLAHLVRHAPHQQLHTCLSSASSSCVSFAIKALNPVTVFVFWQDNQPRSHQRRRSST